jgi:1-acyl-sn-glycerol-3-phosphate acyltransferase
VRSTSPDDVTPPRALPAPGPPTIARRAARAVLRSLGWRVEVTWPSVPRCVIVVYPHTSNWDFVIGYLARLALGIPLQWMGKDSLFRGPLGALLRRMGGVPVNRREHTGFIAQLVGEMRRRPWMWIALAPEGTRTHTDHWRSGFYHLALAARAPVGLAFIDYGARVVGLRTYVELTGDEAIDLERIRLAYAGKVGRHPEQASEIRLQPGEDRAR